MHSSFCEKILMHSSKHGPSGDRVGIGASEEALLAVVVRRRAPRLPNGLYSSQAVAGEGHAYASSGGMRAASGIIPCVPRSECALALAACSSAESLLNECSTQHV
jgi:hypothetical protein